MRLAIVIGAAAAALCLGVEWSRACSCVPPNAETLLKQADAAFVGTLVSRRPAVPAPGSPSSSVDPDIFTFRVGQAIKGDLDREVEVWSARSGASCGLEVGVGQEIGLFLSRSGDRWRSGLCWQVPATALRKALSPLPVPDGRGPVRYLVGGQFPGARLLALDALGRPLGYGRGTGTTEFVSVCPRGERSAEFVSGPSGRVAVRDIRTLAILREVPLPTGTTVTELFCRDQRARDVYVAARRPGGPRSSILRIRGRSVLEIYAGPARSTVFRAKAAVLSEIGGHIVRLDLPTGKLRVLARLPFGFGHLAVNRTGDRIAGVQAGRGRLVLLRLGRTGRVVRSLSLRSNSRFFSGELRWLDGTRLLVLDHNTGLARVFDGRLRGIGPSQTWSPTDSVVASGIVYGLVRSPVPLGPVMLEAAKLPRQGGRRVRQLPGTPAALATVPGAITLNQNRSLSCFREATSRRRD